MLPAGAGDIGDQPRWYGGIDVGGFREDAFAQFGVDQARGLHVKVDQKDGRERDQDDSGYDGVSSCRRPARRFFGATDVALTRPSILRLGKSMTIPG